MNETYLLIGVFALIIAFISWRFESRQVKKDKVKIVSHSGYVWMFIIFGVLALLKGSGLVTMDWFG